jgi:hypothetical protein
MFDMTKDSVPLSESAGASSGLSLYLVEPHGFLMSAMTHLAK